MRFTVRYGAALLVCGAALAPGCSPSKPGAGDAAGDVTVELAIVPEPPKVGDAEAGVTLKDKDGQPLRGATVKLEGNMNHAGMEPVFADAVEVAPGRYKATLKFTMGGDWFVLVTGALADGRALNRKIDVPGVKSR